MNPRFDYLVTSYLAQVERAVKLLRKEENTKTLLEAWRSGCLAKSGVLEGRFKCEFHGICCAVDFEDCRVDFDFGPNNRSDCFDLWRLKQYLSSVDARVFGYVDETELADDFRLALAASRICKLENSNLYILA